MAKAYFRREYITIANGDFRLVLLIAKGNTLAMNSQSSNPTMGKSLSEFVKEKGQTKAAELLGLSQGSLSKALGLGRKVFVEEAADGGYTAHEVRPFPSKTSKSAA